MAGGRGAENVSRGTFFAKFLAKKFFGWQGRRTSDIRIEVIVAALIAIEGQG